MTSRRLVLLSLAGLLAALTSTGPMHGLDWTVDITTDENDAVCAVGDCSLREAIAAAGATSIKDMGGVMAALKGKYAGQMDFAKASTAVKKALSA